MMTRRNFGICWVEEVKFKHRHPTDDEEPLEFETKMYVLSDAGGAIRITEVPADKNNLVSGDVCLIDAGTQVYVWIGNDSSKREHQVSMLVVEKHLKAMGRANTTTVTRVLQGQESRCRGFRQCSLNLFRHVVEYDLFG